MDAISNKESVIGVERTVGAVDKIGLEMGVMVLLGESMVINAFLITNYQSYSYPKKTAKI